MLWILLGNLEATMKILEAAAATGSHVKITWVKATGDAGVWNQEKENPHTLLLYPLSLQAPRLQAPSAFINQNES